MCSLHNPMHPSAWPLSPPPQQCVPCLPALCFAEKGGMAAALAGGIFDIGDRVAAITGIGAPAFGARGTVVGTYDDAVEASGKGLTCEAGAWSRDSGCGSLGAEMGGRSAGRLARRGWVAGGCARCFLCPCFCSPHAQCLPFV